MIRWGRATGAGLGLLLLAAPFGTGALRAQTPATTTTTTTTTPAPTCPDVAEQAEVDRIRYARTSPPATPAIVVEQVTLGATFENVAEPVGPRQPELERVDGRIVPCEADQLLPEESEAFRSNPDDQNRPLTLEWSPTFKTNGTYAIVFDAVGRRPTALGSEAQDRRAVQHITLAVPPRKPTNVEVSDPTNGAVTVSWVYVDPEPDLFGFEIRRARQGSGDYTTIKNGVVDPKVRTVSDSPPVGAWRYQVISYRKGAPEGAVSRDGTVEVAEAAPAADTAGGGATGTSGGATSGTGAGASTTTLGGSPGSPTTPRASVDLTNFAATLNARRKAPVARIEPPDPGFQETLPFDAPAQLEVEEEPAELGADEPNVGLGQRPVSDPGDRQRSLGFVAFGLMLFVLSMTGLFVKSEVKRADLLDLDAVGDDVPEDVVALPVVAAAAATRTARRRRRIAEPDVGEAVEPATEAPRRPRRAVPVRAATEPAPAAAAVVAAASTRRRRAVPVDVPAAEPAPRRRRHPAPASPVEIPETRRRWTGRAVERPSNGHASPAMHDFDDLAVPRAEPATARPRPRPEAMPLDAPGLDVPDPVAPAAPRSGTKPRAGSARR